MEAQRHHFCEAINRLNNDILKMGTLVEEAMQNAMHALKTKDYELAGKTIDNDEKINQLELEIQDKLTVLIATEQPVARDLRHIITSLKVVTQLERMGDHAVHIAKSAIRLKGEDYVKPLIDLPKMGEIGVQMLHEILSAFTECDDKRAQQIAEMDDEIDNLNNQVWRELITYMMEDSSLIRQVTSLLFVCRWLERFGDHVTNISEWIVYDATGAHTELNL
ncbi:MAG: phosphate signaling complex protein PhoU [bacterium]